MSHTKAKLVDGSWGWLVVAGSFLGHFVLVGCSRSSGVMYLAWVDRFSAGTASTAWIQGLQNAVTMLLGE